MRVVIDAMCAEYGGIRTYVEHLLARWPVLYPEDEVHVALRGRSTLTTQGLARHEFAVRRPDAAHRPWVQATKMHRLTRRLRPDVVLATAPTTDVRRSAAPLGVVILDLRADLLPEQFSRVRRLLRKVSYERSYRMAAGFLSISQRSLDDLHRLHPATANRPGIVAYLGSDHVHSWPASAGAARSGAAVAFAHHTNKNPHLVIEAWAELRRRGADVPPLTFLGVSRDLRPSLSAAIDEHSLRDVVTLSGFLPDAEFQEIFSQASMVVFPSDFEGFGLPVVEGMALRKPLVISSDAGLVEVAGGHASVMSDMTPAALADAVIAAGSRSEDELDAAAAWANLFTWDRCVHTTRGALLEFLRRPPSRAGTAGRQ